MTPSTSSLESDIGDVRNEPTYAGDFSSRSQGTDHGAADHEIYSSRSLAELATFPEQNPNPVLEVDSGGTITYMNPEALKRFPGLAREGEVNPLLADIPGVLESLRESGQPYTEREVAIGDWVFEERICRLSLETGDLARIYAHDVTERRRAEQEIHDLARRLVQVQEDERARISRELHDEAGQALAALKISLQLMRQEFDDRGPLSAALEDATTLVEDTREQVRLLAQGLRPSSLDTLGLEAALSQFCHDFARRTGISITYRDTPLPEISDHTRMSLYRIVQEALANVAVHSGATSADVELSYDDNRVSVRVVDDGRGFDTDDPSRVRPNGLGIIGMRERVKLLSGALRITSTQGEGTEVIAEIPLRVR